MTRTRALLAAAALATACRHAQRAHPPEAPLSAEPAPRPAPGHPPVPATPQGLLGKEAVRDVQRALSERGYLAGHGTGELDADTSAAVLRFQKDEGLAATGFPDRATVQKLGLDPEKVLGGPQGAER